MRLADRIAANESRRDGFIGLALIFLAMAFALWSAWPGELPDQLPQQVPPLVYAAGR